MSNKHSLKSKPRSPWIKKYIKMYQQGLSTYQIAEKLNRKPNSVRWALKDWNIPMRILGIDIENKVEKWLIKKGKKVIHMKGDYPYDLLINHKRIDVKSAHISKSGKYPVYRFALMHKDSLHKDYQKELDEFYLVFLDELDIPIYSLKTKDIFVKGLSIKRSMKTKYPLQFIGYLES